MSLLEQASLVITPNAVKESKLYSVVPADGSGDMDVVRATTATRVNEQGLIEVVPRNLASYSEEFNNATFWALSNLGTITANTTISPDGTQNADTLNAGANSAQVQGAIVGTSGAVYTVSMWVKRITGTGNVFLRAVENADTLIAVTSDWQRITATVTSTTTTIRIGVKLLTSGDAIAIWGAQLEQGSTATEYFPTTTRLNIPRIDYTNGSCPSILVEPQRTNLLLRSEEFDVSPWSTLAGSTITANTNIAPDGTLSAYTLSDTSTTAIQIVNQNIAVNINTTYTSSIFIKKTTGILTHYPVINIRYSGFSTRVTRAIINTNDGTFLVPSSNVSSYSIIIKDYGNYWRVEYTTTDDTSNDSLSFQIYPAASINGIDTDSSATGSNVFWGAQLEAGSTATSYIPTVAATITKNADVISKTGIADLIGQTEGTLFFNGNYKQLSTTARFITISNATNSNLVQFYTPANSSSLRGYIAINGTVIFDATIKNLNISEFFKIAIAYKSGDTKIYVDGNLLITRNIIYTTGIFSVLNLANQSNNSSFEGQVQSLMIFPTALTDTELAQLTTI